MTSSGSCIPYPLQLSQGNGRKSRTLQYSIWQCAPIASTSPFIFVFESFADDMMVAPVSRLSMLMWGRLQKTPSLSEMFRNIVRRRRKRREGRKPRQLSWRLLISRNAWDSSEGGTLVLVSGSEATHGFSHCLRLIITLQRLEFQITKTNPGHYKIKTIKIKTLTTPEGKRRIPATLAVLDAHWTGWSS